MFCKKCGVQNDNDAKFCKSCGANLTDGNDFSMYDGEIKKCPNCGELVDSFTFKCKACGYEFRDTNVASSINELKRNLEKINSSNLRDSIWARSFGQVGQRTSKMVEVIKSFNIPNTKEDIIELMFLASSNIIIDNTMNSNTTLRTNDNALSDAWKSKMEQAYQKAKITLNNDPSFSQIEDIYLRKTKEIMNAKRIGTIKFILFFAGIISIFILPLILLLLLYK